MTGAQTIKELIDLSCKTTMEVDSLWLTESLHNVAETPKLSLSAPTFSEPGLYSLSGMTA